ncbi:GNAT family N-acetyltransferase [Citricoccus muralis]|uniref:Ribosomal-protein-alanine N-acetyltransferase n=1 Tax=Citricoccus muralis TaxID=169134 RepID=A0A3D9LCR3_9MICC|nr:GNAT family protein [Citricoccus muralis]REE03660.1 ribosomal-protein-alanine N-acetyltransferase [Citricoccus muralis]
MPPATTPRTHRWPVSLEHGDLVLRPFRRWDQEEWTSLRTRNRDWLRRWDATNPEPATALKSYAEMVKVLNRSGKEGTALPWLICVRTSAAGVPVIAGQLSVSSIVRGSALSASLGYWIDQARAGQGLVPTAVALATDYCFSTLGLHRMEINIRPENVPSRRVVEKLGFRHEGMRRDFLHIDGAWRDHDAYALTAPEVPEGLLDRWERC